MRASTIAQAHHLLSRPGDYNTGPTASIASQTGWQHGAAVRPPPMSPESRKPRFQ
ncbi:hypothetical protein CCACVL1_02075 [Corchorus capsularis]|uniref:Uncharacterized protein n=1 Tax=Corchorus capsularis TaxID=210143 RepID=A0A1R3KD38_COCAP|nr:hypothetical protein CCACVL1_02075 [Corchorus capsularis]